jgi:phage gpG-like protein
MAANIVDEIIKIIKDEWQRMPDALSLYISDNLGEDIGAETFRKGQEPRKLRAARNPSKGRGSLRQVSGDLFRATQPGGRGNINQLKVLNGQFELTYGIDVKEIPYANIHEYGGTIKHPGGTKYFFNEDDQIVFLPKTARRFRGITKPHDIRIPARPYLKPGIQDFEREEIPKVLRRIDKRIRSLF